MVSFIIFCDLFTVAQDWDFPSFRKPFEVSGRILIAGRLSKFLKRLPECPSCRRFSRFLPRAEFFSFTITGAWLTYGPLLMVMLIDLFCTRTQVLYEPKDYGQYVRGFGDGVSSVRIWTIRDTEYLARAYSGGVLINASMVSYEARWDPATGKPLGQSGLLDFELKSQHTGEPYRYFAVLPGILMMIVFPFLVYFGNKRKGTLKALASFACSPVNLINEIKLRFGHEKGSPRRPDEEEGGHEEADDFKLSVCEWDADEEAATEGAAAEALALAVAQTTVAPGHPGPGAMMTDEAEKGVAATPAEAPATKESTGALPGQVDSGRRMARSV